MNSFQIWWLPCWNGSSLQPWCWLWKIFSGHRMRFKCRLSAQDELKKSCLLRVWVISSISRTLDVNNKTADRKIGPVMLHGNKRYLLVLFLLNKWCTFMPYFDLLFLPVLYSCSFMNSDAVLIWTHNHSVLTLRWRYFQNMKIAALLDGKGAHFIH